MCVAWRVVCQQEPHQRTHERAPAHRILARIVGHFAALTNVNLLPPALRASARTRDNTRQRAPQGGALHRTRLTTRPPQAGAALLLRRRARRAAAQPVRRARTSPAAARVRQSERAAARRVLGALLRGTHAALRRACAVCGISGGGGAVRLRPRAAALGWRRRACWPHPAADKLAGFC
jgi:hypothetical protein